jgi:hypothetical protein
MPIKPAHKRFKTLVVKTALFTLGRSFHSASKLDPDIRNFRDIPLNGCMVVLLDSP